MAKNRGNAGFTLVELMVAILCGTIVTAAAITIMLLGLRINRSAVDTALAQYDARVVLSVLEDLATEGTIKKVEQSGSDWKILDSSEAGAPPRFRYESKNGKIYSGSSVLIDGVLSSSVVLNPSGLLTFRIETKSGDYSSSVYCRTAVEGKEILDNFNSVVDIPVTDDNSDSEDALAAEGAARYKFLEILISQYDSDGRIKRNDGTYTDTYFSKWYASQPETNVTGDWGKGTAWCACYVSWAADAISGYLSSEVPLYASVPTWLNSIINTSSWKLRGPSYDPIPGDLVFFDWDYDSTSSKLDPEHIGVVYYVEYDKDGDPATIYTIEGNSGNRVAVRQYPANSFYILGYGVLDWKTS